MQRYYVLTCNQLLQFMSDPVSGHWLWPTNQCLKPAPTDRGQQSKRSSLGTPGLARQVWMVQEVTLKQHQDRSHEYCLYRLQWQIAQLLQQNTKNTEGFWTHHLQGRSSDVHKRQHGLAPTYLCDELRRPADDDYVLPHQRLWISSVHCWRQSISCRSRSSVEQSSIACHCRPPLSPSSVLVLNLISSHFLIPLSDSSLSCTVPAHWLVILDTLIVFTFNILKKI